MIQYNYNDNDEDTTPRSIGNYNNSPRDDRFYTPRTQAILRQNSSNSNSENEWITPRYGESPRYSDNEFTTPRMYHQSNQHKNSPRANNNSYNNNSYYNNINNSNSYDDFYQAGIKSNKYNDEKEIDNQYNRSNKYLPPTRSGNTTSTTNTVNYNKSESKYNEVHHNYIAEETEDNYDDNVEVSLDLSGVSGGLSQKDIVDIFSYARHGRVEEIEKLFTKGLPVDVRDSFGNTVLIIACQNGNKRVAKAVLRRGANINARNHKGNTPLHYCCHYGYGDTLGQYIISKGADVDARNNAGKSVSQGI